METMSLPLPDVAVKSSQVTFEDVRNALGDLDPNSTNASKIRAVLGRGSFATIQKHLETIRESLRQAENPVLTSALPAAPVDLVQALWGSAYAHASNAFHVRFDRLSLERDQLVSQLDALRLDLSDALQRVDQAEQELNDACVVRDSASSLLVQSKQSFDLLSVEFARYREQATSDAAQALQLVTHDLEMEKRDRTIERQSMQSTIDSLTSQVGELKSLLAIQSRQPVAGAKPSRPAVPPAKPAVLKDKRGTQSGE